MAQARGRRRDRIPSALEAIRQALADALESGASADEDPPGTARPDRAR